MSTAVRRAYREISQNIADCASKNDRNPDSVALLAVSKTRTVDEIEAAYSAGARYFGENYLQEALHKIRWFQDQETAGSESYSDLSWHFIGALQSNKAKEVATNFSWVHTIDREKIARRLAHLRPDHLPPLQVCVQVNLHDEPQKGGVHPDALADLVALMTTLPTLNVRGLMILPAKAVEPREAFDALAALFESLTTTISDPPRQWDTLSMGMSADYSAAIAAGSTMVRIGTALFGARIN